MVRTQPTLRMELQLKPEEIHRTGVMCPVIQEEVTVPCELRACVFHTQVSKCHKCALVYANQRTDDLTIADLALLYQRSESSIAAEVKATVARLRTQMTGDDAEWTFIAQPGVCSCCEIPIEDEIHRVAGYDYCSPGCAQKIAPTNLHLISVAEVQFQ